MGFIGDVVIHQEDSFKPDLNINKPKASPLGSTCEGPNNGPRFETDDASHNDPDDTQLTANAPIAPPIAIVGMAARLPGDVRSMESFWDLLTSKRDVSTEVPGSRFNIDAFYSDSRPMTVKSRRGFFLNDELDKVDPSVFGMSNDKAGLIDPQQRLLLELVWECMESAGQVNWRGKDIGTYVGNFGEDWLELCLKDPVAMHRHQVFAASDFSLSSRVSYEYDLRGPSMTIRTACSASMIALHEACQSVASGECSGAIVAGSNIILTPTMTTNMSENGVISVDGECRTFDADANGYARGECVNAIYVKKLDQAIQDGDPIRAIIRSTTANSNGRTSKPAVPSAEAQSNLIRKAYQRAGILDPTRTGLFECHGTGTAAGDVTEAEAIARVFGASGVIIGAAKPNVGHSEGASALTSLIKGVLCLEHRAIPPSARFETPNPRIPFKGANLRVAKELLPWPEDRDERVSVNSFGIGGSNAHAILESARSWSVGLTSTENILSANDSSKLVIVSAVSQESLDQKLVQLAAYCRDRDVASQDLAYTLGERRDHWRHRAFAIIQQGALTELPVFKKHHSSLQKPQSMVFVFPGQGSQWPGMGKRLFETFSCFREAIRTMDRVLQSLLQPPTWTLEDKFTTIGDPSCFLRAEYSQPLCAAVQIGLVDLLASWNVHPNAVIGHSSGEMVAAYAAKSITAETAITIAYYRGQASGSLKKRGGMASIGLGREAIMQYLEDGVVLACENSLQSVVISGDQDALVRVLDRVKEAHPDVFTGRLEVETAYHSHHMADVGPEMEKMLHDRIQFCTPEISFYSTVHGKELTKADCLDAQYWRRNLESMVLFQTAVKTALENLQEGTSFFLEIGPHCSLSGPLRQIIRDVKPKSPVHYFPTLHRAQDEVSDALEAAGQLFLQGFPILLSSINGPGKLLTDLPPYPWNYSKSARFENRVANSWRHRQFCHHELLGSRAIESSDLEPFWRNILSLENSAWLSDHKFSQSVVYPAAAHIAAVGEAVRQMTGTTAFSIRNLFIKKALLLDINKDVEVTTSLKSSSLTDLLDSDWFDFTISSFNGTEWTKHCTGQVSGAQHPKSTVKVISSFIRTVDVSDWYKSFRRIGLDYGPYFQGLNNVTADPVKRIAAGTISRNGDLSEVGGFAIHPTLIDKALQLVAVAATRGISRDLDRVAIPISIDKIYVETCTSANLEAEADCRGVTNGNFTGDVSVTQNDNVVLDIRGIRCFPMDEDSPDSSDSQFSRVIWKEDIEFMPSLSGILPPSPAKYEAELLLTEQVCVLNMMIFHGSMKNKSSKEPHFIKYINWLNSQVKRFEAGEYTIVPETKDWAKMSVEDQRSLLSSLKSALVDLGPKWGCLPELMDRINRAGPELAEGRINPLEVLMEDNGLENIYTIAAGLINYDVFLQTLSHSKPSMRILEIGAGTGTTTADVLSSLQTPGIGRLYSEYFFTDISPGFFASAREQFQQFSGIVFKPLDITHDPVGQGFQEGYFDLIIAANVLHATPCLKETLSNVRKLLAPGGYLLLQELHPESIRVDCVMGLLPQWWLGENDGRPEKPYVSPDRWDKELRSAGFTGVEVTSYDNVWPHHSSASMISRTQHSTATYSPNVSFLYDGTFNQSAKMIEQAFLQDGYNVNWLTLKGNDLSHEHVVSLLDLDTPFFEDISEADFIAFRTFMATSAPKSILWITRDTQMRCADPRWSLALGMMRTLRLEFSIPCAAFEMISVDQATLSSLVKVQQKIQSSSNSALDPDYEYSSEGERVFTSRYYPGHLSTNRENAYELPESKKLTIATCGLLDTIQWVRFEPQLPGSGELEIDIRYVGLNFKDLMHAMGFIGQKDDIGLEATGVIRRVGPGPHGQAFREGDQVVVCGSSLLRTSAVISSRSCIRLPPGVSLEDAATVSVAFCTVIYSLITLGGLQKGQSVLIHSAAGGVGLAAIQVCQLLGAEIYATVGNDAKVQYLVDKYQIPRHRIFNSRNPSFKDGVLGETNGKGVDVVLNSLSGENLHASWECVAEFGKMIEIGKRDMMGHGKLNMNSFLNNRSFIAFDLLGLAFGRPDECQRLIKTVGSYLEQGAVKPIEPKNIFEARDVGAAFRLMQTGQHMGKIVIKIPEDPSEIPVSVTTSPLSFSPDVSYLLVGGLGGLGVAIARWMAERGARSLVFFSRSGNNTENSRTFIQELVAMGCTANVVAGDVVHMEDVMRAISSCPKPLAGVIQLAMVMKDQTFVNMKHQDWLASLAPKVTGTRNLYRAIENPNKLDFFLMFGSIMGICGNIGQSNYAAANCFLDAFAKVCRAEGCPACVIQLGGMADIGYISQRPELQGIYKENTIDLLTERDLLQAVQVAIEQARLTGTNRDDPSASTVVIGLQQFVRSIPREAYRRDRRFASCLLSIEEPKSTPLDTDRMNKFIADVKTDPSILELPSTLDLLIEEIATIISGQSSEFESVEAAGEIEIDSLMTIEIRSWVRKRLNIEISTLHISKAKNVHGLALLIVENLKSRHSLKDGERIIDEKTEGDVKE